MKDPAIISGLPLLAAPRAAAAAGDGDEALMETARAFESVFVAQMLAYSGFGKALAAEGGFGGDAFSSLLVEQYADRLVERGGFGLAEKVYEQLRERGAANGGRIIA